MRGRSNPEVAIVADDLSGATDCAAAFGGAGRRLMVLLGDADPFPEEHAIGADVIARSADSRDLGPAAASRATTAAVEVLLALAPHRWFKKIDSTLRGHLAIELAVLLERLAPPVTIVAPAFPATGRTLRGGHAYLHGEPLGATAVWRGTDLAEVAHLPQMLAAGGVPAAAIGRAKIATGELTRQLRSASRSTGVFVVDAETDSDLRDLVTAGDTCGRDVLWVGSAGLAEALAERLGPTNRPMTSCTERSERGPGPVLVAVGSLAGPSRRQLARLSSERGIATTVISPTELLGNRAEAREAATASLRTAMIAGRDAAVAIAPTPVVSGDSEASGRLADRLGEVIASVCDHAHGLVLTGGDTARATLAATGARALSITGSVQPGVPVSRMLPGALSVVTKAGAFGDEDALVRAVDVLHQPLDALPEVPPR